jgi:hypothetical protein
MMLPTKWAKINIEDCKQFVEGVVNDVDTKLPKLCYGCDIRCEECWSVGWLLISKVILLLQWIVILNIL